MRLLWIGIIGAGLALCAILLVKIITWQKDEKLYRHIVLNQEKDNVIPARGEIMDYKGRILATSTIAYDINLDCKMADSALWYGNIEALSKGLAEILGERSAAEWQKYLQGGRDAKRGSLPIGHKVPHMKVTRIRQLPIFNKGQFKGGYIEKRQDKRLYPYGETAKRVIGYVVDNAGKTKSKGIEGAYNDQLHGRNGTQAMSRTDDGMAPVNHPDNIEALDGKSIRTTLDIDIQTIAEQALRKSVMKSPYIEKGCVIVLETKTGAVRAMANLSQYPNGTVTDDNNHAVLRAEAPGSVFKGAVLAAMLDDGYLNTLEYKIPTYGGRWSYNGIEYKDLEHVGPRRFPSGYIKVREAFEMSANNPFRQLICDEKTYGRNPAKFIDKVKSFGLFDSLAFDLPGIAQPFILDPSMKQRTTKGFWDGGSFPRIAIGYGMELSPLHLVTFYNAIANDGKMMKPYLVEAVMEDGKDVQTFSPTVLKEQICSKAAIDTLKRVMSMVASSKNGTAHSQLEGAVCPMAGKTGTAQRLIECRDGKWRYKDPADPVMKSHQGSFVGFFPVKNPKYTVIAVVWSRKSPLNHYGATYGAPVFREIADKIYCLNED